MGASASLDRLELAVEPGQQVTVQLRVRNNGTVVDQFGFEALGAGAAWIEVEPEFLSLFPDAEGTVTVFFRPPRSPNVAPGPTPFGIKVVSGEDAGGSTVEEGVITVGQFADRTVELYPLTARGRRKGRFEVAVDNRGNSPIHVEFAGSDPENACRYDFAQPSLVVAPGTAHFTKFDVVPHDHFWKGPLKTHQFQVVVTERARQVAALEPQMAGASALAPPQAGSVPAPSPVATPAPQTVNGTLMQEAMLPPWLIKAVLALLALILVLWILWITLFKPTVESAAKDAVAAPLASLAAKVDAIAPGAGGGGGAATTTTTPGGGGVTTATTTTTPGSPTTTAAPPPGGFVSPFGNPSDFRLTFEPANVPPGPALDVTHPFTASFALTDLVLQNPRGDTGLITFRRGTNILFTSALENFRDLDLHFVAPYLFKSGETMMMSVICTAPGQGQPGCTPSASIGGFSK